MCRFRPVVPGCAALAAIGVLLATLQARAQDRQPTSDIASVRPPEALPFELGSGFLIVVEGRIGTLAPLRFVLDTGATQTVVDERIADRLSLKRGESTKLLHFNSYVNVEWVDLPELKIGSLRAQNLRALTGNLHDFSDYGNGIDAIIGLDVLRTARIMRVDYDHRRITFAAPEEMAPVRPSDVWIVSLYVQGRRLRLVLDTGIQTTVLYEDRIRQNLSQMEFSDRLKAHAGRLKGETTVVSGVQLGQRRLRLAVFLIPRAPGTIPADIDGFLGTSALQADLVEFDFDTNTLRLGNNRAPVSPHQ